jgi:hypothetical protein
LGFSEFLLCIVNKIEDKKPAFFLIPNNPFATSEIADQQDKEIAIVLVVGFLRGETMAIQSLWKKWG